MKIKLFLVALVAIASVSFTSEISNSTYPAVTSRNYATVKICLSGSSYAYHAYVCQGLRKCKVSVKEVSLQEAKKMGRKACGYCY